MRRVRDMLSLRFQFEMFQRQLVTPMTRVEYEEG